MALIHLDAGVVIGLLDGDDAHHVAATQALSRSQRAGDRFAMAASAFAECMVGPARRGERALTIVDELVQRLPIDVVDLDARIARGAAQLRARHARLRLPDALVIATADAQGADRLITTDRGWPTSRQLRAACSIVVL